MNIKPYVLPSTRFLSQTFKLSLNPIPQIPNSTHFFSSTTSPDDEIDTIFHLINTADSPQTLKESLKSTQIRLTNDLIDGVLRKVRFSHSNPLQALEFFNYTARKREFYHTQYSFDTLLYALGRVRKFDKVWEVLVDARRNDRSLISPRTMQVVLGRIAKVCSVRQTVESFWKFRRLVCEFDTTCYNALIRTLCQEKSMSDARNVYHKLKHEFKPDLETFNILLSGWKSVVEAEGFFDEMLALGVKPDIVTYNCLVDVYCKGKEMDKAYKVVEKMRGEEISPDVYTYTSIIGGLGLIGQPDKARNVLKEMKELGCYPDAAAYNAVIRNFCIAKRLGDAYSMIDEMVHKGLGPNATTYNLLFRCYFWVSDLRSSWTLYKRMMSEGCLPNTQSCMFLIRLFKKQEKVEMALQLWNDMVEQGFGSYILVSDVLFDLLCDMGKLDDAERCFLQMIEKRQKPSAVSFKRIRVLMELANRPENLENLWKKLAMFGPVVEERDRVERKKISSSLLS